MIRLLLILVLVALPAHAHHSRANFDSNRSVTITGTLTDFAWKNPHIYLEVDTLEEDGTTRTWLIEAHSVTGMRRNGWDADTLTEGQTITVSGQPDRDSDKHFMLMNYVLMPDGNRMYAFGNRGGDGPQAEIQASTDFSGTWGLDMRQFNIRLAGGAPPADWPYTEEGRRQADAYDVYENPELDCKAIGVPRIIIYPYALNISREDDRIGMHKEHLDEKRTIWLDPAHPDIQETPASAVGTSIGELLSERELRIRTDNFIPVVWGMTNGIDSSAEKTVEEIYVLEEGGMKMSLTITVTDPVYFTEPVTLTGSLSKQANRELVETPCDPEAASRHLTVE